MKIAILIYDGLTALDAVGPYEVLSCLPGAKVHFVSTELGPKRAHTNFLSVLADYTLDDISDPEIVLVPGGTKGTMAAARDPRILSWLRKAHETSNWTTSVCTGSLILGAAGILKGLQATTHWYARELLEKFGAQYLSERVVRQGKIITAAGVSLRALIWLFILRRRSQDRRWRRPFNCLSNTIHNRLPILDPSQKQSLQLLN